METAATATAMITPIVVQAHRLSTPLLMRCGAGPVSAAANCSASSFLGPRPLRRHSHSRTSATMSTRAFRSEHHAKPYRHRPATRVSSSRKSHTPWVLSNHRVDIQPLSGHGSTRGLRVHGATVPLDQITDRSEMHRRTTAMSVPARGPNQPPNTRGGGAPAIAVRQRCQTRGVDLVTRIRSPPAAASRNPPQLYSSHPPL